MAVTNTKTDAVMTQDARQLLSLARDWMKQGNTTVAFHLLNEALNLGETERDPLIKGEISNEFGKAYMRTGQWDRAEDAYNQAVSVFISQDHYRGAAESTRNLANMKFQLGLFDESDQLCSKAIDWSTKSGDFQLRATILNTQGAIKSIRGEQKEAIKIFGICLSDFRRSGHQLRQAHILHNIGLAHIEISAYDEAKKALEEALSLALECKDINLVELCYQNIAKLYLKLSDIVAARSLIIAAKELLDTLKTPNLEVDLAIIEAEACRLAGDPAKANRILDEALEMSRKHNLIQHEAEILYEAGQVAIEQDYVSIARSRLEAAITLLKKTGGAQLDKAVEKLKNLEISAKKSLQA